MPCTAGFQLVNAGTRSEKCVRIAGTNLTPVMTPSGATAFAVVGSSGASGLTVDRARQSPVLKSLFKGSKVLSLDELKQRAAEPGSPDDPARTGAIFALGPRKLVILGVACAAVLLFFVFRKV